MRRWASLRARLLLLVLLGVLPTLAVIVDTGLEQRRYAVQEVQDNARRLALLAARDHGNLIREGRQLLTALAEVPQVLEARSDACRRFLGRLATVDERFANFGVIRPDGRIVCSGVPLSNAVNVADRSYFRRAIEARGFAVGDYQIGRITGVPVLVLAHPVYDGEGGLRAVLYAALNLEWLNQFAARAELQAGASMTVLDDTGRVLARAPDGDGWVGRRAPESSVLAEGYEETEGAITLAPGPGGERQLYAIAHMEGLPEGSDIHVVVAMPAADVQAPLERLLVRNLSVVGILFLVVLGIAWVAGDVLIMRRANLLADAARRLGAGDLSARTGIASGGDELSMLAVTFDRMADSLERRSREADEHARRVARLNRVYAVLSGINGAILRIRDRDALLAEACRIAVEVGGFRLAWVGLLDEASQTVRPAASAGEGRPYLRQLHISLDPGKPEGQGPTAEAVREGRPVICNDIAQDPRMAPWRERARAIGFAASAAFPLSVEGHTVGAINLYASEPGFFDAEETRLLEELAADTSLGLEHIDQGRRIDYLAYHDPVTDLPNIRLFMDRLAQALARARHHQRVVAVEVFAIEGLREAVSAVGRHAGDRILQEVASYLRDRVRDGDTVARLDGDEFGLVLTDVARLDDVVQVTEDIARDFPSSILVADEEVFVRARVEVAVHPNDGDDADTLLGHARMALQAPAARRPAGVSFYAHGFNEAVQERRRVLQALHHALERGEFALHYQPVMDLASGEPLGFEALARWHNPELGPVSPATFIPIAEETGLIVPIGEWVLREAARQQRRWRAQGLDVGRISVNVSARQLREPGFAHQVDGVLEEIGWEPGDAALAIEVTETELMEDIDQSVSILRELRERGLAVYVDDFGTGYSSLVYLQRLPVDVLKIDQGFVRGLPKNPGDVALIRSIVALAQALDLRVIAEGIETEGQRAALASLGCDAAQGFLFSRPLPADAVPAFLEGHRRERRRAP